MKPILVKLIQLGVSPETTLKEARLYHQTNGLAALFGGLALTSVLVFVGMGFSWPPIVIQAISTVVYSAVLILTSTRQLMAARQVLIYYFEIQMFLGSCIFFTEGLSEGTYTSNVMLFLIFPPTLALILELSILRHSLIALLLITLLHFMPYVFPALVGVVVNPTQQMFFFSMAIYYILIMFAGIMYIIDNQRKWSERKIAQQVQALHESQEELQGLNQEITAQNEELYQNQEEILTQRDFIEQKLKELEIANRRMGNNEEVLRKAFQRLKEKESQVVAFNKELQSLNNQMQSSINAAQTIQQAILPTQAQLQNAFQDYFVLYKPKDIVSGDFYWMSQTSTHRFVVVADCTGHGVPGAFMTLIGALLLHRIIKLEHIYTPSRILEALHQHIGEALRQGQTGNNSGMDIAVLRLPKRDIAQEPALFAGAKLNLYVYRQGASTLDKVAGARRSVGGWQNPHTLFVDHDVALEPGIQLYMGSDGIQDQNNSQRKRLGDKAILGALLAEAQSPMQRQKEVVEALLNEHQGQELQRDDMLMVGLKY
ncbi:SpoIIE family protein phosphatase [Eisenibacter elegans]|uniref:SpoIIE family protein phosphatase n=1 Tax=Eisenibacter elegans TaxID=997 RepID=UPI0004129BFE|nr:SpoIIE family protein phosphatase [Eisenibacter elegans]